MQSKFNHPKHLDPQSQETLDFIKENQDANPKDAALKASNNPKINVLFAVNQISGKQIAKTKLPNWYMNKQVIYPAHISMEQCSSQATAQYKAQIVHNLIKDNNLNKSKTTLIDLTGGFGVDCAIMSKEFSESICAEKQEELSAISQHNMIVMGLKNVHCVNCTSSEVLNNVNSATIIYIDPARRDQKGSRTYAIEDCTPNVIKLKSQMLDASKFVIIKLSPMLDWRKAICDFDGNVSQVHIISHNNECKELLLVLDANLHNIIEIHCVNNENITVFCAKYDSSLHKVEESYEISNIATNVMENWRNLAKYVYEPNASIMKAGCFNLLIQKYGVYQIASNSHIFISENCNSDFPGKIWKIEEVCSMNKKEIKQIISDLEYANIATYNFPMSVNDLKKKLKLKDGGTTRILATTDSKNQHVIIRASKVTDKQIIYNK